jgi:hypothetical protein
LLGARVEAMKSIGQLNQQPAVMMVSPEWYGWKTWPPQCMPWETESTSEREATLLTPLLRIWSSELLCTHQNLPVPSPSQVQNACSKRNAQLKHWLAILPWFSQTDRDAAIKTTEQVLKSKQETVACSRRVCGHFLSGWLWLLLSRINN